MGKIVMGYWDCIYCGRKKIPGTTKTCPGCSNPVGKGVEYYMSGTPEYLPEDEARNYGKGPDWECSYCNSYNKDSSQTCERCGATREASAKNYFEIHNIKSSQEQYVRNSNETVVRKSNSGKNVGEKIVSRLNDGWECKYCHTINYKSIDVCIKCGGAKEEHKQFSGVKQNCSFENEDYEQENSRDYDKPERVYEPVKEYSNIKKTGNKFKTFFQDNLSYILGGAGIVFGIVALVFLLIAIFKPKEAIVDVTSVTWQGKLVVEDYKTYHESGWSVPSGGRITDKRTEISHYKQVLDHYETKTRTVSHTELVGYDTHYSYSNNGDGTFTEHESRTPKYQTVYSTETYQEPVYRSEPVYDTKYYYDIERWKTKEILYTNGTDKKPYYYAYKCLDNERAIEIGYEYHIIGTTTKKNKIKNVDFTVGESTWEKIYAGDKLRVKVVLGNVTEIIEKIE